MRYRYCMFEILQRYDSALRPAQSSLTQRLLECVQSSTSQQTGVPSSIAMHAVAVQPDHAIRKHLNAAGLTKSACKLSPSESAFAVWRTAL